MPQKEKKQNIFWRMFNLEIFNSNVSRLNVSFDIFVRLQITAGETHNSMLAFWYAWTFTHRPNCTESELQLMCTIVRVHNCDTMKVHNCEKMKVHNCEQLKLHNLLGKSAQLWTTESAKLCKSNLANGTEDTSRLVRERRRPPIESCDGVFTQLSWNSQLSVLSDANKRKYIWSDLFRGLMVEVVKEAEMLADGTTANVRAALSGKAAITRPAKRAI